VVSETASETAAETEVGTGAKTVKAEEAMEAEVAEVAEEALASGEEADGRGAAPPRTRRSASSTRSTT
jgi:hypothetical protein